MIRSPHGERLVAMSLVAVCLLCCTWIATGIETLRSGTESRRGKLELLEKLRSEGVVPGAAHARCEPIPALDGLFSGLRVVRVQTVAGPQLQLRPVASPEGLR